VGGEGALTFLIGCLLGWLGEGFCRGLVIGGSVESDSHTGEKGEKNPMDGYNRGLLCKAITSPLLYG
jgi:hypothetical protein